MKEKYKNCVGPSKDKYEMFLTRSLDMEKKLKEEGTKYPKLLLCGNGLEFSGNLENRKGWGHL